MNKERMKKNTYYNLIKTCSNMVFPVIIFSYVSRVLQTENIGKINFSSSIISYISLLASLGITSYAIRECAKVKEDEYVLKKRACQIYSINLCTTMGAYLILGILLVVFSKLRNYNTIIIVQSICIFFNALAAEWLDTAMEDIKFVAILSFFSQLVALVTTVFLVKESDDYLVYVIITAVCACIPGVVNFFRHKLIYQLKFVSDMEWRRHLTPIFIMFSMILSQTVYASSDITILGVIRGDYEVGLYSVSVKIYNIVNTLIASISYVVIPQLAYYFETNNYDEINKTLKYALSFICTLGIPSIVGINVIASEMVEILAGKEYLEAVPALHILTVALLFSLIGGFIGNIILIPSLKEKICLRACAVSAIINIVLNLVLIPNYGLNAAAFTTVLAEIIGICITFSHIDKKIRIEGIKNILFAPCVGGCGIILIKVLLGVIQNLWIRTMATILGSVIWYVLILIVFKNEFAMNIQKRCRVKR